jgi:hypothetical protein
MFVRGILDPINIGEGCKGERIRLETRPGPSLKPFKQWLEASKLGRPQNIKSPFIYKPIFIIKIHK